MKSEVVIISQKPKKYKPICFSVSAASSWVALGIIPGSLKLVRNKVDMTNKNKTAATAGMAGLISCVRYWQLQWQKEKNNVQVKNCVTLI